MYYDVQFVNLRIENVGQGTTHVVDTVTKQSKKYMNNYFL